ncbi:MAG: hypothetical protein LBJ00_12910 [Planctomycetaceae bacterium]|jgi:ABC-type dipeptide/oligopeptide/nickel transport system ATPase component|nr:hypothetical protein [Planctomycetaceae bacterium]
MTVKDFGSNPFSVCNWQAGSIEYIFDSEVNIGEIFARLTAAGGVGQIVGKHGSGKSTLLESLERHLTKSGLNVQKILLNSTKKSLPQNFLLSLQKKDTNTVHILDGYEQLSLLSKIKLRMKNLHNTGGFIFTTHKLAAFVPIIHKTIARYEIFQHLVRNMIKNNNFKINDKQIEQIFKETNGNFRDGFFKLYDLFEESIADFLGNSSH